MFNHGGEGGGQPTCSPCKADTALSSCVVFYYDQVQNLDCIILDQ